MYTENMRSWGFTLIELVVVFALMSILLALTISLINPIHQLNKAKDSRKQSDLSQIRAALDLYYDDNKCYPANLSFGLEWKSTQGTIYMKKIPSSPDNATPYKYVSESSLSCAQWYTIFAKFSVAAQLGNVKNRLCPLVNLASCLPPDDSSNHICVYGGQIDCGYISSHPLGD